jgi:rubrerythrin
MATTDYRSVDSSVPPQLATDRQSDETARQDPVDLRCSDCGYGIAYSATPPRCPMCGGTSWTIVRARAG